MKHALDDDRYPLDPLKAIPAKLEPLRPAPPPLRPLPAGGTVTLRGRRR
jgi:hypothetical protein